MIREEIVSKLVATNDWGKGDTPRVAERAKYRCEYCDLDLLESVFNYKLFEIDHIVPKSLLGPEADDIENLALSCRVCNVNLKGRWDPRTEIDGQTPTRDELIETVRKHVDETREIRRQDLDNVWNIVGYPFKDST